MLAEELVRTCKLKVQDGGNSILEPQVFLWISMDCDFVFSASFSRRRRGPRVLAFKTNVCFLQLTILDCDVV